MNRSGRIFISLVFAAAVAFPAAAQGQTLEVVGQSNLGGTGLNGQVVTVDNLAIVGSGVLGGAGARSGFYSTYPCPATTVKVVDVSNPGSPVVRSQIEVPNKAVASDVDALRVDNASFKGILLAVALVRCANDVVGNASERGVAYYDITDPANPKFLSRFNPDENFFFTSDPPCSLADSTRCASSNDNVTLVQRDDGKVLSLSTEPFSSNSQPNNVRPQCGMPGFPAECKYRGDVRIVDVTNPATPTFTGSYPNAAPLNNGVEQRPPGYTPPGGVPQPISTSNNGCRNFNAALSVGVQNGNRALVPYLDGGLFTVDIGNPAAPSTLGRYAYPTNRQLEGNAAYVDFATVNGRQLALVGENDHIGPESSLRINGTGPLAGSKFACEASFTLFDPEDTAQVYRKPGSQIPGDIVYVGRACPGDAILATASSLAGKIAFRDRNKIADREPTPGTNCSVGASVAALQTAGALGVVVANTSATAPQAITLDGDPVVGPADLRIPVTMIDTGDGNALRDALCPVQTGGGCGPGGQTLSGAMVDSKGDWGTLRVIDITDPANPTLRGTYRPPAAGIFPPPDLGVYAVHHAIASGSTAFVAGHANGLRAIDLTRADPTEIASFVPPDRADPTGSIPGKANVVGVDVAANDSIVISDVNSGLYVLRLKPPPGNPPGNPPVKPPVKPPVNPPVTPATTGKFAAKLSLARARLIRSDRVVDVLAPITSLASGRVKVELYAAGQRFRFTAAIDSVNGRIRFRQRISKAQADMGTGILTIEYAGDADTKPQTVRLRAAAQKANLNLSRPTIVGGRVKASGTISGKARGVVRVQVQYDYLGKTRDLKFRAQINGGKWALNEKLSPTDLVGIAARQGTVHSYTLFTGYLPRRMRGEMRSFQVLGER